MFKIGDCLYYANRKSKQAEKCIVIERMFQFPLAYIVKNETSGVIMKCYDICCFSSEKEAYNDAQIKEERIIK